MLIRSSRPKAAPAPARHRHGAFAGNPYFVFGPRPYREGRLRSYIVRQHRGGRPLAAIVNDPYVRRCGSETLCWQVLQDPRTLRALNRDIHDAIERCAP